jgi:arylsulfatase A-like enzyme
MNSSRPNILIFMTDQQKGNTVLKGTREKALTPNLDLFSKSAVTFRNTYCPSPHCCPSRATFMSGLYPSQHGVWNNVNVGNAISRGPFKGVRLWSQDLAEAGYNMDFSGKWHVSDHESPGDYGWTEHLTQHHKEAWGNVPVTYEWDWYKKNEEVSQDKKRKEGELFREGYPNYSLYGENENPYKDMQVVEDGIEIIKKRKKGETPWCQFIGTLGPHDAYYPPKKFIDMYKDYEPELPPSFNDDLKDKPAFYQRTRDTFSEIQEQECKEAIRRYLAFCTYEDYLFGMVIAALEETGEIDNTIVIYTSDHGDYMGDHGLWTKGLPCFRGAYHVPLMIRWTKGVINQGRIAEEFISLADICPTLLEAAGVKTNRLFAGASLMPLLKDEKPANWRSKVYTQTNGNELYGIQRSVMTKDFKYVYNGFDYDELYDIKNDPEEMRNLARNPEYKKIIREMAIDMWKFARQNDDTCVNPYIMVRFAPVGPGTAFYK